MAEKKIKKYVWEANTRFRIVFLRGVYPPFKQLNNNFLPVLGHFWASLVFFFTCLAVSPLHYMYNVMQRNGCFPLFIRVSGLFAILPVIAPFPLPFLSLSFPFLPSFALFSLPSLPFGVLGRVPGQQSSKEQRRSKQQRTKKNKEEQRDWNKGAF